MRCPDMVMSAMSYHPRRRRGRVARAYWSFAAGWQRDNGSLHRRGGQWYLTELASRFRFRSVRQILAKALPFAVRRQRRDGGFQADCPASSACEVALAYSRHGMLRALLDQLRYDPIPLIDSLDTPVGLKARREALRRPREDDRDLARRLAETMAAGQRGDGSWGGLILATVHAIHGLLDCGARVEGRPVRRACNWLLAQQRAPGRDLFGDVPAIELSGMFWSEPLSAETAFGRRHHPEYRWESEPPSCLGLLPIYQTGAALGALCRSGLSETGPVKKGFDDLLCLRGPGGKYYTNHWCACGVGRWLRTSARKFT